MAHSLSGLTLNASTKSIMLLINRCLLMSVDGINLQINIHAGAGIASTGISGNERVNFDVSFGDVGGTTIMKCLRQ